MHRNACLGCLHFWPEMQVSGRYCKTGMLCDIVISWIASNSHFAIEELTVEVMELWTVFNEYYSLLGQSSNIRNFVCIFNIGWVMLKKVRLYFKSIDFTVRKPFPNSGHQGTGGPLIMNCFTPNMSGDMTI